MKPYLMILFYASTIISLGFVLLLAYWYLCT